MLAHQYLSRHAYIYFAEYPYGQPLRLFIDQTAIVTLEHSVACASRNNPKWADDCQIPPRTSVIVPSPPKATTTECLAACCANSQHG